MGQCSAKQDTKEPETVSGDGKGKEEAPAEHGNLEEKTSAEQVKLEEKISTHPDGDEGTMEYRLRFQDGTGAEISPWHDIALRTGGGDVFNVVIEIPKMTRHKMEVNTKERGNPIAQDVKKGKLRDYHGPIFWNYGMFPQTWEDPNILHPELQVRGDNDPLDVVEVGSKALDVGTVAQVKVIGVLAMIDDGELDWKVIAVRTDDALASSINDIPDLEAQCPGIVPGIREWLRWYKTPDDKPLNNFGFQEVALGKDKALEVIAETHEAWRKLRDGATDSGKLWVRAEKTQDTAMPDALIGG